MQGKEHQKLRDGLDKKPSKAKREDIAHYQNRTDDLVMDKKYCKNITSDTLYH